ncbi:MAG: hypothetical protein KBC91_05905 [Candidatus Omnitrophica bacterium]|nr:hypothetical protein [Candidatus Omnitrophota bacterium]
MNEKDQWKKVCRSELPTGVSWYKPHLNVSLDLILKFADQGIQKLLMWMCS